MTAALTEILTAAREAVTDPETYRDLLVIGLAGAAAIGILAIYATMPV